MLGKTSLAADAAPHYSALANEVNSHDSDLTVEPLLIVSLSNEECHSMAISWKEIVGGTLNDKVFSRVFR